MKIVPMSLQERIAKLKEVQRGMGELLSHGEPLVQAKDRKYQVWQRNSLGVPLQSSAVFNQKPEYIHDNPVKAGLCKYPEDYKYSSARFYERK